MSTEFGEAALSALATRALAGLGLEDRDAADAARILVLGELMGLSTHGMGRIESYGERLDLGGIKARPDIRVERVAPAIAKVDGDNGVGPLVGMRALQAAMAMARETGAGIVFARASNHFGPVAPYSLIAAEAGFASIIGSNASTTIAPWGGREARLGNSPVGFCVPHPGGRPVILDMALSVVARAKIRNAAKRGESIPPTWATDREGRPTTDPKEALDGFLLPIGGHKGYGLALVVDLFAGLLSGAAFLTRVGSWSDNPEAPSDLGHFFFLIDASRLGPPDWLAARMREFAAILHDTPPANPASPVLLPGEIELDRLERHRREGIALDTELVERLEALAARSGA
ncbi:MAG: Ldh family oxidoreductase [Betaproteobacteria bacterium]|nr:Ldh family oxidoreductase [Betaproteobacteria bacterium]